MRPIHDTDAANGPVGSEITHCCWSQAAFEQISIWPLFLFSSYSVFLEIRTMAVINWICAIGFGDEKDMFGIPIIFSKKCISML